MCPNCTMFNCHARPTEMRSLFYAQIPWEPRTHLTAYFPLLMEDKDIQHILIITVFFFCTWMKWLCCFFTPDELQQLLTSCFFFFLQVWENSHDSLLHSEAEEGPKTGSEEEEEMRTPVSAKERQKERERETGRERGGICGRFHFLLHVTKKGRSKTELNLFFCFAVCHFQHIFDGFLPEISFAHKCLITMMHSGSKLEVRPSGCVLSFYCLINWCDFFIYLSWMDVLYTQLWCETHSTRMDL